MDHYVHIIEDATGKVIKEMGPMSERKAEKVERGANINLNHERFTVVISDEKAKAS
jgi:nitrogen regulatory protein PII-like uncharacterized protein